MKVGVELAIFSSFGNKTRLSRVRAPVDHSPRSRILNHVFLAPKSLSHALDPLDSLL